MVILGITTELNWKGFFVGAITSLVMLLHSPIFKRIAPKKYVSMFFIALTAQIALLHYYFIPEPNKENECRALAVYKFNVCVLDFTTEARQRSSKQLLYFFAVVVLSCKIMWNLRVGELGQEFFASSIEHVESAHPKSEFPAAQREKLISLENSYYINYFVKKVSLIMDVKWDKGTTESDRLAYAFFESIPYVDDKKLLEKYIVYGEYKNFERHMSKKKMVLNFLKIIVEAVFNFITLNNIISMLMLGWIIFFMFLKNHVPTIWTLIALFGIACIGVVKFEHFLKVAQTFIVIPLFLNL